MIGMGFWTLAGEITDANDALLIILGYTRTEFLSQKPHWIDITPPEYHSLDQQALAQIRHSGVCIPYEKEYIRQDGTRVPILCGGAAFEDTTESGVFFVLDLSERKRTEAERRQIEQERDRLLQLERAACAEAEAANRVKDEFLMVLSHELRTPLNPILGWARLLKMRQFTPGMVTHALETIERNALHQAHLIEDLLDVSRILQGKLSLNCCPVDLVEVIQGAIASVQLAADAKSIVITTQLDTTVRPVLGNAARLQQVVWNLLSNAVKFTPEGGQVEVQLQEIRSAEKEIKNHEVLESEDLTNHPPVSHPPATELTFKPFSISHSPSPSPPYAQITVTDTGKGIEASFIPYVFDYFRQSDSTTTRASGGLGLGLAIARHLVELHGGSITAASDGTGRGAAFTVQLPIPIEARKPESIPPDNTAPGVQLQGKQILVVGAEDDARELIAVILEQAGAEVVAVDSVAASLEALARSQPDVLVSSIDLLRENEYELLQRLRLWFQEFGEEIPVVALTTYAEEIDLQEALTIGVQHILSSSIEPHALIAAIAQAMG